MMSPAKRLYTDAILWILTQCIINALAKYDTDLLLFATPGGRGMGPGVYRGNVNVDKQFYPRNIVRISQDCMNATSNDFEDRFVKSIYLDLASANTLIHVGAPMYMNEVTLYRLPLCKRFQTVHCTTSNGIKPVLLEVIINTHMISSFASFDDQIYFISERVYKDFSDNLHRKVIELRNLTGCEDNLDIPYTSATAFYIDSCTSSIAIISDEMYNTSAQYGTTHGLAIVPTLNGLVFYTQIRHLPLNMQDFNAKFPTDSLILKRIVAEDGYVESMHEEYITSEHRQYIIPGLGQITYRDGVLCWTALDRIVCAKMDKRARVSHTRTILPAGKAMEVCKASPSVPFLGTVTTGIGIAKVPKDINKDEIALYFGCIAQSRDVGGAGFVRKRGNKAARLSLLRENRSTIYAGSLLVTDICSEPEEPQLFLLGSAAVHLHIYYNSIFHVMFGVVCVSLSRFIL